MSIVVYLETSDVAVRSASLPALTAARALAQHRGGPIVGVVIGSGLDAAAKDAARYVDKVLAYDAPELRAPLAETYAPVLVAALKAAGADALVASATSTGKDVLPRTAALLGAGMASDISSVEGAAKFKRPTYAGNAVTTVEVTSPTVIVSARQTAFEAAAPLATVGGVELQPAGTVDARGAAFVALHASKSERPDLTEASIVVSGGRGMKSGENFKVLEELTDLLGGALGASRAAADAGMVPNDLQVGQTGKVVAPKLYIAVAISGAIQHLAGMKGSKTIVAINKDAEAPIFQVADYGLVGDWEKVVPAMIEEVKKLKA
ncbi:MAG: electron transfer flavoprotein subunit alpha/FixB family protein [Myxococcales bacterium]|nr:electron transfer flavoprotein subunit alpha/FixB family protein [Myxococcales bacterium]